MEDAENELTVTARNILRNLLDQLVSLDKEITEITMTLVELTKQIPVCHELARMPDVGLVPGHTGSGGKNKNSGITKYGDRYLRALLVHGARSAISNIRDKQDGLSCWIRGQLVTHHFNNTTVALANKLLRMAWAILSAGGQYQAPAAQ